MRPRNIILLVLAVGVLLWDLRVLSLPLVILGVTSSPASTQTQAPTHSIEESLDANEQEPAPSTLPSAEEEAEIAEAEEEEEAVIEQRHR